MATSGASGGSSSGKDNFIVARFRQWYQTLPPYSTVSLTRFYIPLTGAISYCAFSLNVFAPRLLQSLLPFTSLGTSNFFLLNSHIGIGFYVFYRRHLSSLAPYRRTMYTIYNTVIFNLGSVLLWALTKNLLPHNSILRSGFALSSSVTLLNIGMEYLEHVDADYRS